jgi:hypothetical protein
MRSHSSLDDGKANSLVFSFGGELWVEHSLDGPEPDFLKWVDNALFADVATAGDEAEDERFPADEREAWRLFHDSIEATSNLFDLYKQNPQLFRKIASRMSFLPCLMSWHPNAEHFNRKLFNFSRLGQDSMYGELRQHPRHLAKQTWPVRYAYAIMATIDLTLDTYEDQLPIWAEIYGYGVKHPIPLSEYDSAIKKLGWDEAKKRRELLKYEGRYRILPLWTKSLKKLRRPFSKDHVLDYWHTGKEMILEEMPAFHMRAEWATYRDKRAYQGGAKKGAIQHAIFKDILIALKTIAGSNHKHRRPAYKAVTK